MKVEREECPVGDLIVMVSSAQMPAWHHPDVHQSSIQIPIDPFRLVA